VVPFDKRRKFMAVLVVWIVATVAASLDSVVAGGAAAVPTRGAGVLRIVAVDATSSLSGHYARYATDGKTATSWAACGADQALTFDLGRAETLRGVKIAFASSRLYRYSFSVQVSSDATRTQWSTVLRAKSAHRAGFQVFRLAHPASGRYVRLVGHGNSGPKARCRTRVAEVRLVGRPFFSAGFESDNAVGFNEMECKNARRQFAVVDTRARRGRYAARFSEGPGDVWLGNDTIRCLAINGQTNERAGNDYYYSLALYFPKRPTENLLWETHARPNIYSISDTLSVAPNAIVATGATPWYNALARGLSYRLAAGRAMWDGTRWTGWGASHTWRIVSPLPLRTWIDLIIHVRFRATATGLVQVWERSGGRPWPAKPQVNQAGVPTLQYVPGGEDPSVPSLVGTSSLYDALGLYKGSNLASQTDVVFVDAYSANSTLSAAKAHLRR
jgi:F5/8 type C domain-containing protein/polysaccharide lyase-like protein